MRLERRLRGRGESDGGLGFTLLEVVIGLLVLELAVLGAAGLMVLASATLGRAERLERASARAEGVLDSLATVPQPGDGSARDSTGEVRWRVSPSGGVVVVASGPRGDTLLSLVSVLPPRPSP